MASAVLPVALAAVATVPLPGRDTWRDETHARLQLEVLAPAPDAFTTFVVADVDGDGDEDVLAARRGPGDGLLVAEGERLVDRTRALAPGLLEAADTRALVARDVDADGRTDLLVATTDGVRVLRARRAGGAPAWSLPDEADGWTAPPGAHLADAAAADLTGDGLVDLYLVDDGGREPDRLLVNAGDGSFRDESWRLGPGAAGGPHATCAIADVDGDGDQDLLAMAGPFGPRVLRLAGNDGSGRFPSWQLLPFDHAATFAVADLDGDGRRDLYVVSDAQDYVLLQREDEDGAARWCRRAVATPATARLGGRARVVDLERDGRDEVGVADVDPWTGGCGGRFGLVAWREGKQVFGAPEHGPAPAAGTQDVAWVDVDADGRPDLLQATCEGWRLLMNRGP